MDINIDFPDRLGVLGTLAGAFIILVALGTLSGLPWTTTNNTMAALVQMVGIVVALALGALLVIFSYSEDPGEYLPIQ